ncbi:YDG domain-containing protein [uncultured Flavobacterium sp.]|uniref:YDG domain-containing protein n=1 Tax=uncultured Flavobacterium sp. TaxID=165435 RepID=UPI0025F2A791|nr:YDG domain-containing protein [uncultured Flavobacterium sp.]
MMKLLHQKRLKGLFALALFLTTLVSWGQQVSIAAHNTDYNTSLNGWAGSLPNGFTWNGGSYQGTSTSSTGGGVYSTSNGGFGWRGSSNATSTTLTATFKNNTGSAITSVEIEYKAFTIATNSRTPNWAVSSSLGAVTALNWTQSNDNTPSSPAQKSVTLSNLNIANGATFTVSWSSNRGGGSGSSPLIGLRDVQVRSIAAVGPSDDSDIIRNTAFAEPTNINYALYQATTEINTSNSVEVGSYTIRDGAGTTDGDSNGTTLSAINFTVANFANVSRLALYDGTTKRGDVAVTSGTASFTSLSGLTTTDGGTKTFTLRASFKPTVTDNAQLRFTVSSATAPSSGSSKFAAANAGAATTSVSGDANRIEVAADRLAFATQPSNTAVNAAMTPAVAVSANDANGNRDLDFTANVTLASTGTLTGAPVSVSAATGLATFTGLTHTVAANGLGLTATTNGWSADSAAFNITKATQTITFGALPTVTYGDPNFTLTATGGASGQPIVYTSDDETIATISGDVVTIVGPGEVIIRANQAGNDSYEAASEEMQILTVNKKQLTITGAVAQNKAYDGTDVATVTGATIGSGIVGEDEVVLASPVEAIFEDENVGTGKTVVAYYVLAGAHAAKYELGGDLFDYTADITAKELTVSGIAIANKSFDGTTDAEITGTAELTGVVTGEDVNLTGTATAVFDNIGPGGNIPVTVSGYAITGADIANYTLAQPTGLSANINDTGLANQTITFGALASVTYGDAPFTVSATSTSGLPVSFSSSDENVATVSGNTITITGAGTVTITALQEGNSTYNPAPAVPQELVINKKELIVANAAVTDKVYNGGDIAEVTGTIPGVVSGDDVTLDGTGQFASVDVANGIAVETIYGISGADIDNYFLTQPTGLTGNIVPAELTLPDAVAQSKTYDGTTAAVITGMLTGAVPGDVVTLNGTGTFATPAVGTGILVTSTATLAGDDAGNYVLVQPTGLSADITGKEITVTATADNKEYDRTTNATITITAVTGVETGDNVTVTGGGSFEDFIVGTNKPVTAALSLSGNDAANYTLTQPLGLTAEIIAKELSVTSADVVEKAYDGTDAATIENAVIEGIVAGDENDVQILSGTFAQETPGTGIAVSNLVLTGSAAANYTLAQPTGLTGNIVGMPLSLDNAMALDKIYDGTTSATITGTLTGVASGDNVTFTGTGAFASADVAEGIEVTAAIVLTGTDAANYTITQPVGLTADITPMQLSVSGVSALDKVYDRTTAATISGIASVTAINDDVITLQGSPVAVFNDYNVGERTVSVTGYSLGGSDAANYTLAQPTLVANITPKQVEAQGGEVASKIYDGTTAAQVSGVTLTGLEEGDETVTASTGAYALPNVGTHYVTLALSGAGSGNYELVQPDPLLSGSITKKELIARATNKTINKGQAVGTLAVTFEGFVAGDTTADIAEVPEASVNIPNTNTPGAYTITLSPGDADNYELVLVNGWLIIQEVEQTDVSPNPLAIWSNGVAGSSQSNPYTSGQTYNSTYIAAPTGLGVGSGVGLSSYSNRYGGNNWGTSANSIGTSDYFSFRLAPLSANQIDFVSLTGTWQSSSTGPKKYEVRSSIDNYSSVIASGSVSNTGDPSVMNIDLSSLQNVTSATTNGIAGVELRLYGFNASATGGTFSINDFVMTADITQATAVPGTVPTISNLLANGTTTYTMAHGAENASFDVNATGSPTITFSAAFPEGVEGLASIDPATGVISFDGDILPGSYSIPVTASNYYNTISNPPTSGNTRTLILVVNKIDQQVAFTTQPDPLPANLNPGDTFTVEYTNAAGLPVVIASSNTDVATTETDENGVTTVTIVAAGTANIVASNTGNDIYNPYNGTVTVLNIRSLTVTPNPITSFHAYQGQGPSVPVQITNISGSGLSPEEGSISYTITGPFEVALGVNAYNTSGNFSYTAPGGILNMANPQVAVRLQAGQVIGSYTGSITFTGGGATTVVDLSAIVEAAPSINTTEAAFGPYCAATQNNISVAFTTQGNFPAGFFRVQLSNASGVFPTNISNSISMDAATSPISATLPATMVAGNYRVRVIHISEDLQMTASTNDNGSNIEVKALPTLAGVQAAPVCADENTLITLTGLLANTEVSVSYTLGAVPGVATVTADASGIATFEIAVSDANNGEAVTVQSLTRTDGGSCAATFGSNNSATVVVYPVPTLTAVEVFTTCNGENASIGLTGLAAGSTSTVTYRIEAEAPATVQVIADTDGEGSFELALPTGLYQIEILDITNTATGCTAAFTGMVAPIVVEERPTAAIISEASALCFGTSTEIQIAITGQGTLSLTYTDGTTTHGPVTVNEADITGGVYTLTVTPAEGVNTYSVTALYNGTCSAAPGDLTGSVTITASPNTWQGDAEGDATNWFNPENWSCGEIPSDIVPAYIASGTVKIDNNRTADAAAVNVTGNGHLTVESGSDLVVAGAVAVDNSTHIIAEGEEELYNGEVGDRVLVGGQITIENNANLLQTSNATNINSGNVTVQRNSAPMWRLDYALWSSPVANETLIGFSPETLTNRFYTYDPLEDNFTATTTNSGNIPFGKGTGYLIRVANTHPAYNEDTPAPATQWQGTFVGTPNNGDVTVAVTPGLSGYNAVGNPYASPINVSEFFTQNSGNLVNGSSISFWRKKNNAGTSSYALLTMTGLIVNDDNTWGDTSNGEFDNINNNDNWVINAGQGFIVQANSGTITFNNSMRVGEHHDYQFRSGTQDQPSSASRLWLNLKNEAGQFSQSMIAYTEHTTLDIDFGWDGNAMTDGPVAFYSLVGENKLGIQARPSFTDTDEVPMGYKATAAGTYNVSIDHAEGVFEQGQDIYLRDNLLGITHDLNESAYSFTTEAGTFAGRFDVIYADALSTDKPVLDANTVMVYKQGSDINISSGIVNMTGVKVYDLRGSLLYSNDTVNATETVISGLQAQEQMLIIEVATEKGKVSKKMIF